MRLPRVGTAQQPQHRLVFVIQKTRNVPSLQGTRDGGSPRAAPPWEERLGGLGVNFALLINLERGAVNGEAPLLHL